MPPFIIANGRNPHKTIRKIISKIQRPHPPYDALLEIDC